MPMLTLIKDKAGGGSDGGNFSTYDYFLFAVTLAAFTLAGAKLYGKHPYIGGAAGLATGAMIYGVVPSFMG